MKRPAPSASSSRKSARRSRLLLERLETRDLLAAFTAGNLVVYRVGDGAAATTNAATAVFLDEYTTSGTLVQSIAMPTATSGSNLILTASGTATSEGGVTLSADGRSLILTGYNAAVGTTGIASTSTTAGSNTNARVIGVVDVAGNVNTSAAVTSFSGNNIRSAASSNGYDLWAVGGNSGVVYNTLGTSAVTGTVVSTTFTNMRQVGIFDGQLYTSSASSTLRLGTVGTGLPTTSSQTITNLAGFPTSGGSPYQFFFADLSSTEPGLDTVYVADDGSGQGIQKYSKVSGTWTFNNTVGSIAGLRGITGSVSGTTVTLYASQSTGTGTGSRILSLVDATGHNASITASLSTVLSAAATNTAIRGIAFVPQAVNTVYAKSTWASPADLYIADADPVTAGNQTAYFSSVSTGGTGFATLSNAIATLGTAGGTVYVNAGDYSAENITIPANVTLRLLGTNATTAGTVTIGSIAGAGTIDTGSVGSLANSLVVGNATSTTFSGVISGPGSLTKQGTGTLTLSGTNTYAGPTAVTAGVLSVSADANLGAAPGSATAGSLTLNGGTLQATASFALDANRGVALGSPTASATGTIDVGSGVTLTYGGVIADNGTGADNLAKTGDGTLTLTGTNTYTGTTAVAGTLKLGDGGATGTLAASAGAITVTGTLAVDLTSAYTLSQDISGTGGALTKSSSGALTLTGTNSYTGTTTITGGTLQVGSGGTSGTLGTGAVTNNAVLVFDRSDFYEVAAVIGGTGTLEQAGAGELFLSAASTYTGATTVTAGVLNVTDITESSGTTVAAGATATGLSYGPLSSAGTVDAGDIGVAGTTDVVGDFSTSGTLAVDVDDAAFDSVVVTGTVTVGGALTVGYLGTAGNYAPASGTILTVIDNDGTDAVTGTFSGLANGASVTIDGQPFRIFYVGGDGNDVTLVFAGPQDVVYADDSWTTFAEGNTVADADPVTPGDQPAVFGVNAFLTLTDALAAVTASGTVYVNAGTYAETVALTGTRTLTALGVDASTAGTVSLAGLSSAAGTTIDLDFGTSNSTLSLTGNADATLAGTITGGSGRLTKGGTGSLTLTADNSYFGATTVNAGTLNVGGGTAAGTFGLGDVVVAAGATLVFDRTTDVTVSGAISGAGDIVKDNTNTLTLTADSTASGALTINDGTVSVGQGGTTGSLSDLTIVNDASLVFDRLGTVTTRAVSGDGTLTKRGDGTLVLTEDNTYTGGTTIEAGTIRVGEGGTAGTLGTGDVVNDGALVFDRSDDFVVAMVISGTGTLTQQGTATLILTGNNTYAGTTTVTAGFLQVGNAGTTGTLGTGDVVLDGGNLSFERSDDTTVANLISGTGLVFSQGAGQVTLTADNTYTGGTHVDSGSSLRVGDGGTTGAIGTGNAAVLGTLTFERGDDVTFAGAITNAGDLVKNGAGTLTLSGVSSFTGTTTVAAGTLDVTGTLADSAVTVGLGATLTGTGSVGTADVVGTVNPGTAGTTGTLTTADLTLAGDFAADVDTLAAFDALAVTGSVLLTGTLTLAYVGTGGTLAPVAGDTLTLIANDGTDPVTGTFSNYADGATITIDGKSFKIFYAGGDGNDVVLVSVEAAGTVYVDDTWAGTFNPGQVVPDADPVTPGNQPAVFGATAFASLADGVAAATTSATVYVNSGAYPETASLTGTQSLVLLGIDDATPGVITIDTLSVPAAATLDTGFGGLANALGLGAAADFTVAGVVSGVGSITKFGTGVLTLTGVNTYSGGTTVVAGTLVATGGDALGTGDVLNDGALVFDVSADDSFGQVVSGSGSLAKRGTAALTLTEVSDYTGTTTVEAGTLDVTGTLTGSSLTVDAGATLTGTGSVGPATVTGTVNPGTAGTTNTLSTGNLDLSGTFAADVDSVAGYDALAVSGTVTLSGTLSAVYTGTAGTFAPAAGDVLTLIDNDGTADAVVGTFAGLAQGATVTIDGREFTIFYTGGDGNDVVLVFTPPAGTVYADDDWAALTPGTVIADADPVTAGAQQAVIGYTAFGAIGDALGAVTTGGTVYVNAGTYAEAVTLADGKTLTLLGTSDTAAGTVAVGDFSGAAGTTVQLAFGGLDNTLEAGGAGDTTFAGDLVGAGHFVKVGSGSLTLSGTNTPADVAVNAGTLTAASPDALGTGGVANEATLAFGPGSASTFGNAITGTGVVVVNAGDTVTLSGTSTFTGVTTVLSGTLSVTGSLTSAVTVETGATLEGTGSVGGIAGAGTVAPGVGDVGTLTVNGDVSLDGDFVVEVASPSSADRLAVTGTVSLSGTLTVVYTGAAGTFAPVGGDTLVLIDNDAADAVSGTFSNFAEGASVTIDGQPFRIFYGYGDGNDVVLFCTITPSTVYVDDDWSALTPGTVIPDADPVTAGAQQGIFGFNAFATVADATAGLPAGGTVYVNAGTYAEAVTLTDGVGLVLLGSDDSTAETVTFGSLAGDAGTTIDTGYGGLANVLTVGGDDSSTAYAGLIFGTGSLTKDGSGTLTLTGDNTFTGTTSVNAGTLSLGDGGTGGAVAGDIETAGSVVFDRSDDVEYAGVISGTGDVTKSGDGRLTLSGVSTYTGPTVVAAGVLDVSGDVSASSLLTVDAGAVLNGTGNVGPVSADGTINAGAAGGATGTLSTGDLSFGPGGVLAVNIDSPTAFDTVSVTGTVSLAGTLLTAALAGSMATVAPGAVLTLIANDGSDAVAGEFDGLADGASLTIDGRPFRVFYNGGDGNDVVLVSTPDTATAYIDDDWAALTPGTVVADADPETAGAQPAVIGYDAFATIAGGLAAITVGGTAYVNDGTYAEDVSIFGGKTLAALGLDASTPSNVVVGGLSGAAGNGLVLSLAALDNSFAAGVAADSAFAGVISGAGSFVKDGPATLTLTGTNTYTGATFVSAGTLSVTGSVAASSGVSVLGSATLAGTGSVPAVAGDATSAVAPGVGTTPGTLTTGDYSHAGTLALDVASASSYDALAVTGTVALAGPLTVAFTGTAGTFAPAGGAVLTVIANDGTDAVSGTFAGLPDGADLTIDGRPFRIFYNGGDGNDVILLSVPTPTLVFVDDDWAALAPGSSVPDADPMTAGDQPGVIGYNAFATVPEGLVAVAASGTVKVNAGSYTAPATVSKAGVTLDGNAPTAAAVQLTAAGSTAVTVAASGVTVRDLSVTGATGLSAAGVSGLTLTNLAAVGGGTGLTLTGLTGVTTINDLALTGNADGGSLDTIADLIFSGGAGEIDDTFVASSSSLQHTRGSAAMQSLTLAAVANLTLVGGDGADRFELTPAATGSTAFVVQGGDPSAAGADVLALDLAGVTSPALSATGVGGSFSGAWSFGDRAGVAFTGVETFDGIGLEFTSAPASVKSTAPFAVTVRFRDAATGTDVSYNGPVTVSLDSGPGPLGGTTTVNAVNGVATFNNLTLAGVGPHTLAATAAGFAPAVSPTITVTAAKIVFGTVPYSVRTTRPGLAGFATTTLRVVAQSATGATATGYNGPMTLRVLSGPGALAGTLTVTAVNGVATFSDLYLTRAGTYVFQATAAGVGAVNSHAVVATANSLSVTTTNSNGAPATVTVRALDAAGFVATNFRGVVTLSKAGGPGVPNGTFTVNAVNGVATFSVGNSSAGTVTFQARTTETAPPAAPTNPKGLPPVLLVSAFANVVFARPVSALPGRRVP